MSNLQARIQEPVASSQNSSRRSRRGFTLIEMLAVIGVMMILMAMSIIGYQVVERSAAANQTRVTLTNLNAMLSEMDADAGSSALPTYTYTGTNRQTHQTTTGVQPIIGAGVADPSGQAWPIGDVSTSNYPGNYRYGFVVQQTAMKMQTLLRCPNNSKAIADLPSRKFLPISTTTPLAAPVLLDGWGNPIIYVPTGGIVVNVITGNNQAQLVTITSRDNRPFFASAGPDGDFGAVNSPAVTPTAGDDNVYSREP